MNNRDLIKKGLAPKYLNLRQAAKVADGIKPEHVLQILEQDDRVKYKLVAGEYQVDTLSLLNYLDGFHRYFVAEKERERINNLLDLNRRKQPPVSHTSDLKEQTRCHQENNNE